MERACGPGLGDPECLLLEPFSLYKNYYPKPPFRWMFILKDLLALQTEKKMPYEGTGGPPRSQKESFAMTCVKSSLEVTR